MSKLFLHPNIEYGLSLLVVRGNMYVLDEEGIDFICDQIDIVMNESKFSKKYKNPYHSIEEYEEAEDDL